MTKMIVAVNKSTLKVVNDIQDKSGNNLQSFKNGIIAAFGGTESSYYWINIDENNKSKFFGNEAPQGKMIDYANIIYDNKTGVFTFNYIDISI